MVKPHAIAVRWITLALLASLMPACSAFAQQTTPEAVDPSMAKILAERMCRQLPNVATILTILRTQAPSASTGPPAEPFITDDVYDALLRLGPYSLPCLMERLLDTRWMPDPREEPLLGAPVVGDVAYMILLDKGVGDVLPALAHKQEPRMDDYFIWPSAGDHRQRLQNAVRAWLTIHPDCCGHGPTIPKTSQVKFRMSASQLASFRASFSRLRLGMAPAQVLKITGNPDATDEGLEAPGHEQVGLLGFCSNDHNENLAYIYFTERWTDDVARRDPLRDRYVIAFFSAERKLTRIFSNLAEIPPLFPQSKALWDRLMWGERTKER
jgi:hypothetical protein